MIERRDENDIRPAPDAEEAGNAAGEEEIRALFARTRPHAASLDTDRLLSLARVQALPLHRRAPWLRAVAVLLAVVGAAGAGGAVSKEATRREVEGLRAQLEHAVNISRRELTSEFARLLDATSDGLLAAQERSVKDLALLLRDDYRTRLALLTGRVEELAVATVMAHPISQQRPARTETWKE
jgi:hypothetical protein